MREDEAAAAEERLRAVVTEAGLEWVLDQVDEFALEGKPEFERVNPADRDDSEPLRRRIDVEAGCTPERAIHGC